MNKRLTGVIAASLFLLLGSGAATAQAIEECIPPDSNCFDDNSGNGPGCDNALCEQLVCDVDSYCCDTDWDDICAFGDPDALETFPGAEGLCQPVCEPPAPEPHPCDMDGSGTLEQADLMAVVNCFGHQVNTTSESCDLADVNTDGIVDILDISQCGAEVNAAGQ